MKKNLLRSKAFYIIGIIVLIGCAIGVIMSFNPSIDACLLDYTKIESNDQFFKPEQLIALDKKFEMTELEAKDVIQNPNNYTAYYIDYWIKNSINHKIYDLKVQLDKKYQDLWLGTRISEWQVDIEANESFDSSRLWIIIRTKDMKEDEIDGLIKSIRIIMSVKNLEWLPFYNTITLGFKK